MNLAMHVKTERDAFVEALNYYQKKLTEMEKCYWDLKGQVEAFVKQFAKPNEDQSC